VNRSGPRGSSFGPAFNVEFVGIRLIRATSNPIWAIYYLITGDPLPGIFKDLGQTRAVSNPLPPKKEADDLSGVLGSGISRDLKMDE
jgi:hypothetical protein